MNSRKLVHANLVIWDFCLGSKWAIFCRLITMERIENTENVYMVKSNDIIGLGHKWSAEVVKGRKLGVMSEPKERITGLPTQS